MRRFIALLAIAFASCNTASTMSRDWRIEVKTDGGFTGRGLGTVAVTFDSVEAADLARSCNGAPSEKEREDLQREVSRATPASWKREYVRPENPYGYADQIRYTLTLTRGGETRSTSWYDETREQLPSDAAELFEGAWRIRDRVVKNCR